MTALDLTLVYLLAAVLGVVACRYLKLPPMLGYLVVGVVIGPNALALAQNSEGVRHLGEFGVVFLMFVIGLEFNLSKLRAMRRHVFGLGLLQVTITMLAATLATVFVTTIAPSTWGMSWQTGLALSGALAMSSTAIVVKLMVERIELDSEHGKRVMGVLLFQDLAVVPLLVLIPALGASGEQLFEALALAALPVDAPANVHVRDGACGHVTARTAHLCAHARHRTRGCGCVLLGHRAGVDARIGGRGWLRWWRRGCSCGGARSRSSVRRGSAEATRTTHSPSAASQSRRPQTCHRRVPCCWQSSHRFLCNPTCWLPLAPSAHAFAPWHS